MPQPISSREDIKRDILREWVEISLEWIAQHRQTFFSIAGTVVVAIVVVAFIVSNFKNLRKQAWERYSAGQTWAYSNQPENALNLFNEVITNYSHTPAAAYSFLAKGDVLYKQRKFQEAVDSFKKAMEKDPPKIIVPFILANSGAAYEETADYNSAISSYKQLLSEYSNHYLVPKTYESLARVYECALNPDAAKEIYEKVITLYPSSIWAERARVRYQMVSPQPFQTSPAPSVPPQTQK